MTRVKLIFCLHNLAKLAVAMNLKTFQHLSTKYSELVENLKTNSKSNLIMPRSLKRLDLKLIENYGCWCYFEESDYRGRGQPVDEFDLQCKILQQGYECLQIDYDSLPELAGQTCDPETTEYVSSIGNGQFNHMSLESLKTECDLVNSENTCQAKLCKIEGYFLMRMLQLVLAEFKNPDLQKYDRVQSYSFDPEFMCEVQHSDTFSERACCGDEPLRKAFKTFNGMRGCCSGRTFMTDFHVCCEDGSLKVDSGSC